MMVMAVGNNRFAGGSFEVAPKANLQDGLLELAVLSADTLLPLGAIATQLEDPTSRVNKLLPYRQVS